MAAGRALIRRDVAFLRAHQVRCDITEASDRFFALTDLLKEKGLVAEGELNNDAERDQRLRHHAGGVCGPRWAAGTCVRLTESACAVDDDY
eukprot:gene6774-19905_t